MNTEDSLREYLRLFVKIPLLGRIGPLAKTFDFVADAAPGRQGDPRRRQAVLRGARAQLRPRDRRRRGVGPHRQPDRCAAGDPRPRAGRSRPRSDAVDARHPRRPVAHGRRHRHDAGGDAGHRDDRPARPARPTRPVSTPRRSSPTECCRRCSTGASRRSSTGSTRRCPVLVDAIGPSAPIVLRGRPADRGPAQHRRRAPRPAPRALDSATAARSADVRPADHHRARAVRPRVRSSRGHASSPTRSTDELDPDDLHAARGPHGHERTRPPAGASREMVLVRRIGRRRQDDDRGGARASPPRSGRSGKVLVLTVDPARRLATALGLESFGNTPVRVPAERSRRASRPARRAARRAVGGDARHEGRLGRADPTPRARRRDSRRRAGQPAVREHHEPVRAQPRLPRHGAAPRPARDRAVRPRHRRHAAVAQRAVDPRRAGPDGRLLRQPPAALADRAVPVAAVHRRLEAVLPSGRSGARLAIPAGHRRLLRAVPGDGDGIRASGPARSRSCSSIRAPRSSSSRRSRPRRATRPASSPASSSRRDMSLGAIVANRVLPIGPGRPRSGAQLRRRSSTGPTGRWRAMSPSVMRRRVGQGGRAGARRRSAAVRRPRDGRRRASRSGAPNSPRSAPMLLVGAVDGGRHPRSAGLAALAEHLRSSTDRPALAEPDRQGTWAADRAAAHGTPMVQNQRDDLPRRTVTRALGTESRRHRSPAPTRRRVGLPGRPLFRRSAAVRRGRRPTVAGRRPGPPGHEPDHVRRPTTSARGPTAIESGIIVQAATAGVKVEGEIDVDGDDPTIGADAGDPRAPRRPHHRRAQQGVDACAPAARSASSSATTRSCSRSSPA